MQAILRSFPRSCCEKSGVTGKFFFLLFNSVLGIDILSLLPRYADPRQHSFGAVLEEFELRDAIENIFSGRPEAMVF